MKVLFVGNYLLHNRDDIHDSEGRTCFELISRLEKKGVKPYVIAGYTAIKGKNNWKIYKIFNKYIRDPNIFQRLWFNIKAYYIAKKIIKKEKIKIYHRIGPLCFTRTFDLLSIFKTKISTVMGPQYGPRMPLLQKTKKISYKIKNFMLYYLYKRTVKNANIVILYNPFMKEIVSQKMNIPKNKIIVLSPTITNSLIKNSGRIKKKKSRHICAVGVLVKERNFQMLIKSLQIVNSKIKKKIKVVIIGEGPYKQELLNITKKLGLTKYVEFKGGLPRNKVFENLQKAFALCDPGISQPNKVGFEAIANNTPIIIPKSFYTNGFFNNKTALLFKYDSVNDLSNKILKLLENEQLGKKLVVEAKKLLKKYTIEYTADKIFEIYKKLL